ncbi:hypothetical protein QW131_08360 [Roseibium salinum]|nr:hypothetical protein [Roseibium salinum]
MFRGRSNWSTVDVHEKRSLLEAHGIPGQIRSLLPRLSGSGDGKRKLVAAAHRFDGRETVSELDVPVRIGIDFCAAVDRGGVMLSGWLLDPEDRVEAVFFSSRLTGRSESTKHGPASRVRTSRVHLKTCRLS